MTNKIYLIDLNGNHTIPVENDACIGREHLQNCEDKRISRKHAIFTIEEEKITITATHTNPLFYRTKSDSSLKSLLKNAIVELEESDEIGFLPDKFWFRISSIKLEDSDNTQVDDPETQELVLNEATGEAEAVEPSLPTIRIKNAFEINQLVSSTAVAGSSSTSSSDSQKSKRPSWMLDQNYTIDSSSAKKQKPNASTVMDDDEDESTISVRDIPDEEPAKLNISVASPPVVESNNEVSGNDILPASSHEADEDVDKKEDIKIPDIQSTSDSLDGNDAAASTSSSSTPQVSVITVPQVPVVTIKKEVKVEPADSSSVRVSCQFGIKCYRRNPSHLGEFAHPGDSDYTRPNFPPAPSTAPDCPYGNACYRRNPVHFQSFKHPSSTNPKRNRRKLKQKKLDSGDDSQLSTSAIIGTKRERKKRFLNLDNGLSDDDESDPFDDTDDDTEFVPTDDSDDDDLPDTEDTPNDD